MSEQSNFLPLTEENVNMILDEHINPSLKLHNGAAQVHEISSEDKTLTLRLKGGCAGCPSSIITLFNGIVPVLKRYFDLNDVLLG